MPRLLGNEDQNGRLASNVFPFWIKWTQWSHSSCVANWIDSSVDAVVKKISRARQRSKHSSTSTFSTEFRSFNFHHYIFPLMMMMMMMMSSGSVFFGEKRYKASWEHIRSIMQQHIQVFGKSQKHMKPPWRPHLGGNLETAPQSSGSRRAMDLRMWIPYMI